MDLVSLNSERILEALKLSKMPKKCQGRNNKVRKKLRLSKLLEYMPIIVIKQKISAIIIKVRKKKKNYIFGSLKEI